MHIHQKFRYYNAINESLTDLKVSRLTKDLATNRTQLKILLYELMKNEDEEE